MQRDDFPATRFLCDVIRLQMGKITRDQMRAKWKAGEYRGVDPDWAKWNMERAING